MTTDNLKLWDAVRQVPPACLKTIKAGRLKGMSDIKPQWRIQAITHQFGPCGIGWKYKVTKQWIEDGSNEQKIAFVNIDLFIKDEGEWSDAIPGNGGSMLIAKEKAGLYTSDEAYKMATTDAISSSMKMLGFASDIYMGAWDGTKYNETSGATNPPPTSNAPHQKDHKTELNDKMNLDNITDTDKKTFVEYYRTWHNIEKMEYANFQDLNNRYPEIFMNYLDSIK